jgi:hypothetical protein
MNQTVTTEDLYDFNEDRIPFVVIDGKALTIARAALEG